MSCYSCIPQLDLLVKQHASSPLVVELCLKVIRDPRFARCPASVSVDPPGKPKHHCCAGGLARHTLEVLRFAMASESASSEALDKDVLVLGAVWHDMGKMDEYTVEAQPFKAWLTEEAFWLSHICRGLMLWQYEKDRIDSRTWAHVAHLIASHHGRKEWGSPVEPQTMEAIILHHADVQSVMQDGGVNPQMRT